MPENLYVLKVIAGPLSGKEFPVERTISVGRFGTDIVIQDEKLSRTHASLDVEGHALVVRDHDSTNGTFVNGLRVTGPMPVGDGDIVTLGETQLEVSIPWTGDESSVEQKRTEELPRPAPVVVSGVAKPRGLGIVAAALIIAIGLGAAALAFFSSEDGADTDNGRSNGSGGSEEDIGPSPAKACDRAAREARNIDAGGPAPRRAWIKDVRHARRLRARTLAALVAHGVPERAPAFVAAFRRTDSSLLRLQNSLDSQSSSTGRTQARQEVLERSRFEARMAERADLPRCGRLAI